MSFLPRLDVVNLLAVPRLSLRPLACLLVAALLSVAVIGLIRLIDRQEGDGERPLKRKEENRKISMEKVTLSSCLSF